MWWSLGKTTSSVSVFILQKLVFETGSFLGFQQHSNGDRGFENVELGIIGKKKKIPRRVIHFASGETMEEYSTDEEEDEQEKKDLLPPIDPVSLLSNTSQMLN